MLEVIVLPHFFQIPVLPVLLVKSAMYMRESFREDPNQGALRGGRDQDTFQSNRALKLLSRVSRSFMFSLTGFGWSRQMLKRTLHC